MHQASIRIRIHSRSRIPPSSYFWQPSTPRAHSRSAASTTSDALSYPSCVARSIAASYTSSSMRTVNSMTDPRGVSLSTMSSCWPSLDPSVRPLSSAHRRISAFCSAMLVSSRFVIVICVHEVEHLSHDTPSTPLVVRAPGTCYGLVNPGASQADTRHHAPTRAPRRGGLPTVT